MSSCGPGLVLWLVLVGVLVEAVCEFLSSQPKHKTLKSAGFTAQTKATKQPSKQARKHA